jgi:hypothetical protein
MERRFALCLVAVMNGAVVVGQSGPDTIQAHVEAARAAAGHDHPGLFGQLCTPPAARPPAPQGRAAQPPSTPDRSVWHVGARVILSAADWDLLDRSPEPKPKRDMVATDGQKLTLGDETLTL